MKQEKHR